MSNTRNSRNSKSDPDNVSSETVTVDTAKLDELVAKAVTAATKTLHEEFSKLFDKLKERVNAAEKRIGEIESRVGEEPIRVDTAEKRLDDAMQKLDQESPAERKKRNPSGSGGGTEICQAVKQCRATFQKEKFAIQRIIR